MLEQLVLWGPPVVTLLVAAGYYLWWGKESEANRMDDQTEPAFGGEG